MFLSLVIYCIQPLSAARLKGFPITASRIIAGARKKGWAELACSMGITSSKHCCRSKGLYNKTHPQISHSLCKRNIGKPVIPHANDHFPLLSQTQFHTSFFQRKDVIWTKNAPISQYGGLHERRGCDAPLHTRQFWTCTHCYVRLVAHSTVEPVAQPGCWSCVGFLKADSLAAVLRVTHSCWLRAQHITPINTSSQLSAPHSSK